MGYNNNHAGMHLIKNYAWDNHPGFSEGYDKYAAILRDSVETPKKPSLFREKNYFKPVSNAHYAPKLSKLNGRAVIDKKHGYGIATVISEKIVSITYRNGKTIKYAYPMGFSTGALSML